MIIPLHIPHSQQYRDACVSEFHDHHYQRILAALRRVDHARQKLIQAHNGLILATRDMNNPYAEHIFNTFYKTGGTTAAEWRTAAKPRLYNQDAETCPVGFPLRVVARRKP